MISTPVWVAALVARAEPCEGGFTSEEIAAATRAVIADTEAKLRELRDVGKGRWPDGYLTTEWGPYDAWVLEYDRLFDRLAKLRGIPSDAVWGSAFYREWGLGTW